MKLEKAVMVQETAHGLRLDTFLSASGLGLSRSRAKRLIKQGLVRINEEEIRRPSHIVWPGDVIIVTILEPEEKTVTPREIPLDVLYEDPWLVVINKSAGLSVHPGAGAEDTTLVHGLMYHFNKLSKGYDRSRPGIVHRLDKDTSGVLVVAKEDEAHEGLSIQFRDGLVKKEYIALVRGYPNEPEGVIDFPIGRHPVHRKKMSIVTRSPRVTVTIWKILDELVGATLLSVRILTGRTHQIRVHMAAIGHPVLGDSLYGGPLFVIMGRKRVKIPRQMLHAYRLCFHHPITGKGLCFTASIPLDMAEVIRQLKR